MKFLSVLPIISLFALFTSVFAAPTANANADASTSQLVKRCDTCDSLSHLLVVVESITAEINVTIAACEGVTLSASEKEAVYVKVQGHCGEIISAIASVTLDLKVSIGGVLALVEGELEQIVGLVVQILLEIVYTLLHAVEVLGCTIAVLLGSVLGDLLAGIIALLAQLALVVVGFLAHFEIVIQSVLGLIVEALPGFCTCSI